jgi:hypothetical protein
VSEDRISLPGLPKWVKGFHNRETTVQAVVSVVVSMILIVSGLLMMPSLIANAQQSQWESQN